MKSILMLFLLYVMLVFLLDMFFKMLIILINVVGEFLINILWLMISGLSLYIKLKKNCNYDICINIIDII